MFEAPQVTNLRENGVTQVLTNRYKKSRYNYSESPKAWFSDFGKRLKGHFHAHPNESLDPSRKDIRNLKNKYKHLDITFSIVSKQIRNPGGQVKKALNNLVLALCLCCVLNSCTGQSFTGEGNAEKARLNAISDFINTYKTPANYLEERSGKPFDVFWIDEEDISDDIYVFTFLPEDDSIAIYIKDELGKVPVSNFPNNFIAQKGKLFLWQDDITPLQQEILNIMEKFSALDSIDLKKELGLLPDDYEDVRVIAVDSGLEAVDYYICKNNIEKYTKIVTNKAFGYYPPPELDCSE